MSFHLIALELGDEIEMLDRAVDALDGVDEGETVFFPEYLAWTAHNSGRAFARLIALAQKRRVNLVTTLNLAGDLVEDLPGHRPERRYNAVAIFTQHGVAHVPQGKAAPQWYEMDGSLAGPGIGVQPYPRTNLVTLDVDDELVRARFLIGSDLMLLAHLPPSALACDLLVVLGGLPHGAELQASRLIGRALEAGMTQSVLHVNAGARAVGRKQPLTVAVEEVLDATAETEPRPSWPSPRSIRSAFFLYEEGRARSFAALCRMRGRKGRIPVPRSVWESAIETSAYPVTVVL